jgi:hypothetical protein
MNKKQMLELLIKSFGLTPLDISSYRTDSNGGEYQTRTGWKGSGADETGNHIIRFHEPDGFNMAVYEILRQGKNLPVKYVSK